jgi:hypothetical protein
MKAEKAEEYWYRADLFEKPGGYPGGVTGYDRNIINQRGSGVILDEANREDSPGGF